MAKKKKKESDELSDIIYSKYQKDIFEFIKNGCGNLIIEASAGSGKTFTITHAINLIDTEKKILFVAFNKDIVKVLKKKVGKLPNVDVRTVHSLGLVMLQRNFSDVKMEIDVYKYKSHIIKNLNLYSHIDLNTLKRREYYTYIDNICKLVDLGRFNLSQSIKEMEMIVDMYGVELLADEAEIALEVMLWGKENVSTIDYTDMIWLPNVLYLKPIGLQYDFVFVDEAQDISKAQKDLVLKCQRMGTRFIFTGDENQSIYAFSGVDYNSFNSIRNIPNTISLPLSISYRCPKTIVKFAQNIVPNIEYIDDGRDGEIVYDSKLEDIQDGDMVLCRNNAPLMKVYTDFIRMGKKCFVRGKDIGLNLKKMVESTNKDLLNLDLSNDGVFVRLYSSLFDARDLLMSRNGLDYDTAMSSPIITNKIDIIKALEVLSEGLSTSQELVDRISVMFSDKDMDGISLSTIHKAKGLEADNVYIACNSLMPNKSVKQDWEMQQERNLQYVAYTRAKNKLCFIDEKDFKNFNDNELNSNQLKYIEVKINKLLNKQSKHVLDEKIYAKEIIKHATEIVKPKTISKVLDNKINDNKKSVSDFSLMFKRKNKK